MSESNAPARRNDAVGQLAARLLGRDGPGPDAGPPDLTAAVPLFDALMAEGDVASAMILRAELGNMAAATNWNQIPSHSERRSWVNYITTALNDAMGHLLFDFASTAGCLARRAAEAARPPETRTSTAQIATLRIRAPAGVLRGYHIQIDDHRRGIVVSDVDADGYIDVMPLEDEAGPPLVNEAGSPMNPFPPRRRR